jgi:hypothetical protein
MMSVLYEGKGREEVSEVFIRRHGNTRPHKYNHLAV